MEEDIKTYADSLYENGLMESVRALREAQRSQSPGTGPNIQAILVIYNDHVERSIVARFESYERAFNETGRTPSERDFANILNECKQARVAAIRNSAAALKALVNSPAFHNAPSIPTEAALENSSAHAHDRVLQGWRIWRAKTRLKAGASKTAEREKQTDPLLPIYNRAEFDHEAKALASKSTAASPLSVLFMDLDRFKSINDGPGGHGAGDRALKAFAEVLLRACAGKGTAYRYGGDELCALLPNHSLDEAYAVAERIRRDVRAIKSDNLPNGLRTSIGIACAPEQTADSLQLVSIADRAMYAAKNAGGDRVSGPQPPGADTTPGPVENESKTPGPAKDAEIAALNERIAELSRKPYKETLERIARQVLDQMTLEGRHVLHHLMTKEPVEVGRTIAPGVPGERQNEQLAIAMQQGLVRHQEEGQSLRRYYWVISSQFRPVLEDLLYEEGRL